MLIFGIVFGLFIIGTGFLIQKYPNLISGYNSMSEEKRKNVDIYNVSLLFKKAMIISGTATTCLTILFWYLKLPHLASLSIIAPILISMLITLFLVQKYDYNKQSKFKKNLPFITLFIVVFIVGFLFWGGAKQTKIIISDKTVEFTGMYSTIIPSDKIELVELWYTIPPSKWRINGLSFGNTLKGHFKLDKIGRCKLYIKSKTRPFLYIEYNKGKKILFNSPDSLYTKSIYEQLKSKF